MSEEIEEIALSETLMAAAENNAAAAKSAETQAKLVELGLTGGGGVPVDISPYLVAWELSNDEVTTLEIPNGVTRIKDDLFSSSQIIGELKIPYGVEYIGKSAFYGTKISHVDIPNSVNEIRSYAFGHNENLKTVSIPRDTPIRRIPASCFATTGIEEFFVPDSVEEVGESAFSGTQLRSVSLPNALVKIGGTAFINTKIRSINLPSTLEEIGQGAFYGCENLETVDNIENTKVAQIPTNAFSYCSSLKSIKLPNSVTSIMSYAFMEDISLESVAFNEGLIQIDEQAFYNCQSLRTVVIPKTIEYIGFMSFANCSNLETLSLPGSLFIGGNAFLGCPITCNITADMTLAELEAMSYPPNRWGIEPGAVIHCVDGDYTIPEA